MNRKALADSIILYLKGWICGRWVCYTVFVPGVRASLGSTFFGSMH